MIINPAFEIVSKKEKKNWGKGKGIIIYKKREGGMNYVL